jgi:hypothetical protein
MPTSPQRPRPVPPVHRVFILDGGNSAVSPTVVEVTMKSPLAIVLTAVVLLAVSTLAIMNNACKSSQHEWCAPSTIWHHKAQLSSDG